MQVTCDQCQSKFNLPDEKIPSGKVPSLRCPKCKNTITIDAQKPESMATQDASDDYNADERPFDFIEEEEKTALLCESDAIIREQIVSVLDMMEYHITTCDSARDALKKMRYHIYDLVVLNESFDTVNPDANGILIYLERLNMAVRRNIFALLLSSRFRSTDHLMAFNRSVNLILNLQNIGDFEKIIKRGLAEYDLSYRVFRETLKRLGRV
jgi:predicted Zn finger-like uncharacterized protein